MSYDKNTPITAEVGLVSLSTKLLYPEDNKNGVVCNNPRH